MEPCVEKAREAEIFLIAVDCGKDSAENMEQFDKLRYVAAGMAQKRLLFGVNNDMVGVFKLGSTETKNSLAETCQGGYLHIERVFPAVRSSLETVKCVRGLEPEAVTFLALDSLEVFGDYFASFESAAAKRKRVCLFTHSKFVPIKPRDDILKELIDTCDLYRDAKVQIDVVCSDWKDEFDIDDGEDDNDEKDVPSSQFFECAAEHGIPALWAVARATGGIVVGVEDASDQVIAPQCRVKRPFARYRGTLDIGSIVQIPVKTFYAVSETKKESATKLSWTASQSENRPIGVLAETQKVVSATDSIPLEPEQLVTAYSYGTDLVPVKGDNAEDAWSCNLECGLTTVAFLAIDTVPVHWYMSAVNAVVPMKGVPEAYSAIHALVQALHDDNKGILARWVPRQKGGAPMMVFLWPAIESDSTTGCVKNRFLYLTELPLKEDLRDYPFSNLKKVRESLSLEAESAMDDFIDSRMLGGGLKPNMVKKEENEMFDDNDQVEAPEFISSETCNPVLDRFYATVIQRALDGASGTEIPALSAWQREVLDANTFIAEGQRKDMEKKVKRLKVALAVSKVAPREREKKKVVQALSGDAASISDFLPPETADGYEIEGLDDADPAYLGAATEW